MCNWHYTMWKKKTFKTIRDKLDIDDEIVIERAHRTKNSNWKRPQTVKFHYYQDKHKVLYNANKMTGTNTLRNKVFLS